MEPRVVNAADAPQPVGGYTQALEVRGATRLLFISGQIPEAADGTVPPGFGDQARLVWRSVESQLRAADLSLDNLVKVTTFLSDRRFALENSQVRREVLGKRPVSLTVIIAGILDDRWLVEIEAIAAA